MAYEAIITPIVNIRPHSNADRLNLGTACGHQVILGKETSEGELGIFFPDDGALSHEMCMANKLYIKHPETQEKMGGYFDTNKRVRVQRFRGEKSEGFWCPLSFLTWTEADLSKLKSGQLITELNGKLICEKYISPGLSKQAMARAHGKKSKKIERFHVPTFLEHFDTKKLRYFIDQIPVGPILHFSCKAHGTSGRTGLLPVPKKLNIFQKGWNKLMTWSNLVFPVEQYRIVSGTRRVTLDPDKTETGYYSGTHFRREIHNMFSSLGLYQGETFYYEIVGYTGHNDQQIMPSHVITDAKLKKQYGDKMTYTYGCLPGQYKVLIYRITRLTPDKKDIVDMPWYEVKRRCKQLGLETVYDLGSQVYDGNIENLLEYVDSLTWGPDPLGKTHIREGVCVRVEHSDMTNIFKHKSYYFCELEGIAKDSPEYIDPEEAEENITGDT